MTALQDDIAFDAEAEFAHAQVEIHKNVRTIYDRLKSIYRDSLFVEQVLTSFKLPVAVNERCGRWYVPTQHITTAAYFKSTDGHTDHCKFSLRRLNLHLLRIIRQHHGLILVDSTRRGKRIPDALSKTVPIWCCVINRACSRLHSRSWTEDELTLQTPLKTVGRHEHARIMQQIPGWVDAFLETGGYDPASDLVNLDKPLRPIWVTPESRITGTDSERFLHAPFHPIILVTASRAVADGVERLGGYTYVQGAADDEEMWSRGLTPRVFWRHQDAILSATRDSCLKLCLDLVRDDDDGDDNKDDKDATFVTRIAETHVSLVDAVQFAHLATYCIIDLSMVPQLDTSSAQYMHCPMSHGKRGAALMHQAFPRIETRVRQWESNVSQQQHPILVTDDEHCATKASIVALLLLATTTTDHDHPDVNDGAAQSRRKRIDKAWLQTRLVKIVNSRPGLNPSRASLKSLHEHLMSPGYAPVHRASRDGGGGGNEER